MSKKYAAFSVPDAERIAKHIRRFGGKTPALNRSGGRLNVSAGKRILVTLAQVGGIDGTAIAAATWTYSVTNTLTSVVIYASGAAIDPTTSPHLCSRPNVGKMTAANSGEGMWKSDGAGSFEFVLIAFNEQPNCKKCSV